MVLITIASFLTSFNTSLLVVFLHILSHDCTPCLVTAAPILNPTHKSQPCIGIKGSVTIHPFKSFLKQATSSQRSCNYPLLPLYLLSIVICASIHTSVYCLFTPSSPFLAYLPSWLLRSTMRSTAPEQPCMQQGSGTGSQVFWHSLLSCQVFVLVAFMWQEFFYD